MNYSTFAGKWLACQSMDNQVLIYSVLGRFRQNRKKIFKGHMVRNFQYPAATYIAKLAKVVVGKKLRTGKAQAKGNNILYYYSAQFAGKRLFSFTKKSLLFSSFVASLCYFELYVLIHRTLVMHVK